MTIQLSANDYLDALRQLYAMPRVKRPDIAIDFETNDYGRRLTGRCTVKVEGSQAKEFESIALASVFVAGFMGAQHMIAIKPKEVE